MGNKHRDEWFMALPWVLLGMRVKFQPNLDASSAQMVLQMSPKIPGQLLGDPGVPLNNSQSRALLDQLYRLADRPPIPTSGKRVFKDISHTEDATHVYVKVDGPQSLCPKFEGPYRIVSRPSRSTIEVKLGLFKNGTLRTQIYHWHSCKVAAMRDGDHEAERPKLGRPPQQPEPEEYQPPPKFTKRLQPEPSVEPPQPDQDGGSTSGTDSATSETPMASSDSDKSTGVSTEEQTKANNSTSSGNLRPVRSSRNQKPKYK